MMDGMQQLKMFTALDVTINGRKMENKYYTPELDEFYVGFECETNDDGDWEYYRVKKYTSLLELDKLLKLNGIRVKYLDKSDIESLGWDFNSEHLGPYLKFKFTNSFRYLYFYAQDNKIIIDNGGWYEDNVQYFQGNIKNKSELRRLMKQLGIKIM